MPVYGVLTDWVTIAGQADVPSGLEVVLLASFTVGPVPVLSAVNAVSAVPGPLVQLLVEEALVREPVAVAS